MSVDKCGNLNGHSEAISAAECALAAAHRANRDRSIARSAAVLAGEEDAARTLARCVEMADIAWYRRVVHDNLADGTPAQRAYFLGYDHALAQAVS